MNKQKIIEKFYYDNGACEIDIKNKDIILFDGGLFSIEHKKIMLPKCIKHKKLVNGMYQCIFSKKKYPHDDYRAVFWFEELDEVINYFKRMKRMLNKIGYKTNYKKK